MLKMIIIDDEKIIRESIKAIVPWNDLEIEVIGLCSNGIEGYDMILDENPDIVITDIKVPGLSGLELIKKIKESGSETEFIILSGYNEFDFARQAMQYGVHTYLLKPCNPEELKEAVLTVKNLCIEKRKRDEAEKENTKLLRYFKVNALKAMLLEFVGTKSSYQMVKKNYEPYLNLDSDIYTVFKFENVSFGIMKQIVNTIRLELKQDWSYCTVISFIVGEEFFVVFDSLGMELKSLEDKMNQLTQQPFQSFFGCLNQLALNSEQKIMTAKNIRMYENQQVIQLRKENQNDVLTMMSDKINHCDKEEFASCVQELIDYFNSLSDANQLKEELTTILLQLPRQVKRRTLDNDILEFMKELENIKNLTQIKEAATMRLKKLCFPQKRLKDADEIFTGKIVEYINAHINDSDLSLKYIAENFLYMNVDYVSKKFLKCQGCKYSVFLANIRIEKAKQLMKEKKMSISEVASCVGCGNNPEYFSKLFKKYMKITPTEYMLQLEEAE